jgi:sugar-specific transcriptional regulator TrmB
MYQELMDFGLSEKEAKVYLAALSLGASPVQNIAKEADVNRATTYAVIENLSKRGIMSWYRQGKKVKYFAERPEKVIQHLVNRKRSHLDNKTTHLKKLMPELLARQKKQESKTTLTYYEGKVGVQEATKSIFRGFDEKYRIIYNHDEFYSKFKPRELKNMASDRITKNIKAHIIRVIDKEPPTAPHANQLNVANKKLDISFDLSLYDKMTRIVSLKDPVSAITINNKAITNTFKNLFDLLYEVIEKRKDHVK